MAPPDPRPHTINHPQEGRSRGELANALAAAALAAMSFAYVAMFAVLGCSEYASKFENGELPAGFDGTSGQMAAVTSLGCALVSLVLIGAAFASRATKTAGVVGALLVLAAVPYLVLEFVTWQLAF